MRRRRAGGGAHGGRGRARRRAGRGRVRAPGAHRPAGLRRRGAARRGLSPRRRPSRRTRRGRGGGGGGGRRGAARGVGSPQTCRPRPVLRPRPRAAEEARPGPCRRAAVTRSGGSWPTSSTTGTPTGWTCSRSASRPR